MIAKHVAMSSARRNGFAELVRYLLDDQAKQERVGAVRATNCHSDMPAVAVLEVTSTQRQNTRATSARTYHLIVSFRAGEQPAPATLAAIEAALCDGLGYGAHQRVSVVHHDTDNLHLHVAINKIHPTRFTLHDPHRDYHTLGRLCGQLEQRFGLQQDNHHARKCGVENRAADMEHHTGVQSLIGWIQRDCLVAFDAAGSWTALHAALHVHGIKLQPRGNGLVITSTQGTSVKASAIGRAYARSRLEARLGPFVPAPRRQPPAEVLRPYAAIPLRTGCHGDDLWARYQQAQQHGA